MAMKVFMKIDGMPGSAMESGREDWCEVRGFSHELEYPFDMRENRGAGEPKHGACEVLKQIDKSSPKLAEALTKKRQIGNIEIEFERDNPADGSTEMYYKLELEDVRVIRYRPYIPKGTEGDEGLPHQEAVGFAYRKITWTFDSGGAVESTFDFADPQA